LTVFVDSVLIEKSPTVALNSFQEYYSTYAQRLTSSEFLSGTVQSMEKDDGIWKLQILGWTLVAAIGSMGHLESQNV